MTVQIRYLPNEPIIIAEFDLPFSGTDVAKANEETARLVQTVGGTVYRIEHIVGALSFSDVTDGLIHAGRLGKPGSARDPQVQFLFVGTGPIVEMTAKSFAQDQYAGRHVPLFATQQEAIAYARKQIAELEPAGKKR